MRTAIAVLFVLLAMLGSFFAGNFLSQIRSVPQVDDAKIVAEAKRQVPEPVLPPKPGGHSVTTIQHQTVQVPDVKIVNEKVGGGLGGIFGGVSVPRPVQTTKTITTDVPVTTLVGATPEEMDSWNNQVNQLQENYQADLREKIESLAEQKSAERQEQIIRESKEVVNDLIVPVITATTGLVGAIAALRWGTQKPSNSA